MRGARTVGALAFAALLLLVPSPPAGAQELRDGDVYARVDDGQVVLGNAVAERRWATAGLRTLALLDKRRGGRLWSAGQRDFALSVGGAELGSESFRVDSVDLVRLPRGGIRVLMRLAGSPGGPALGATRIAEAYPGIAGFRTQTVLEAAAPLALSAATLDEAAVGSVSPTIHAFRAGADWRQPGYTGPDLSVGDPHAGTWRASQTAGPGSPLSGPAQWLTAAAGDRSLFMVMERNDFPSSRARYESGLAQLRVEYARDVVILGPLEEQGHVENPVAGDGGRQRTLRPGVPFALEAAFTGFGDHDGDEAWQFHRYLTEHRLAYPKAITFNSNGTDDNRISTGAKDDLDLATVREMAPIARRLGVETFILDDGWQARSGDWQPDSPQFPEPRYDGSSDSRFKPRFPDPRFEAVRREIAPMRLGLWMSPLHFNPSSRTFGQHPEWACQPASTGLLALNSAEPESSSNEAGIVEWSTAAIPHIESRIRDGIESWDATYWKFDFMAWLDCAGQGDVYEMHDAFLAMIDRLQRDHPSVTFQIDETNDYRLFPFESVSRAPSWFQNGSPAPDVLLHNLWNLSPYVPGFSLGQHALGGQHWKRHPVGTLMAAALPSHITFFTDLRELPAEVIEAARPWLAFYKRHRALLTQLTYPLLEDPLEMRWTALQSWNPDRGRGALLAFRQDAEEAVRRIALRNVPAGRRFDLFRAPSGRYAGTVSSAQLSDGLEVRLTAKRQAEVLLIVPARPPRLRLSVGCTRNAPRARLRGRDVRSVRRVDFTLGRRVVARDRRAPFARRLVQSAGGRRVRARATMRDGRAVRLRRVLPRCARRLARERRAAGPRFTG